MMGDELLPKRSLSKYQRLVMINGIYHGKNSVRNSLDKYLMMGNELLPKRSLSKYQRLVIISGIDHVKYISISIVLPTDFVQPVTL